MEHDLRVEQDPREDRQDGLEAARPAGDRQRFLLTSREQHPVPRGYPARSKF